MSGRIVLTGAASGIGRAAAELFAAAGHACLLLDRDGPRLSEVVAALPGGAERHIGLALDLTDPAAFAEVAKMAGSVAAIINNAGMSDPSGVPLAEQSPEQGARLFALNLEAPLRLVEALSDRLEPGARIVNVASGAGLRAIPFRGAYSPTKAALIAQSRALAKARPDLCVTVLCPGFVRTDLVEALIAEGRIDPASATSKIPMARMASPTEMARGLTFLASPEAAPLSGSFVALDGASWVFGGSIRFNNQGAPELAVWAEGTKYLVQNEPELAAYLPQDGAYEAQIRCLDAGACYAGLHQAAADFVKAGSRPASLTLVLPPVPADVQGAADHAAAKMAVATLACEFGATGLRINALQVAPHISAQEVAGVLHWVAGVEAQFLTGQVLDLGSLGQ